MLVVGLTGGIAAGKTVVAETFAGLGAPCIDADAISREVVAPGSEGLTAVVGVFGDDVLDAKGALDRTAMRRRVFADDAARRALEEILHPRIRAVMDERLREHRAQGRAYAIEVVPLLVETGQHARCDRILVVDAPEAVQLARVAARDGVSTDEARSVIQRQVARWERIRHAHDVVANGDTVPAATSLIPQVAALDRKFRLLARAAR